MRASLKVCFEYESISHFEREKENALNVPIFKCGAHVYREKLATRSHANDSAILRAIAVITRRESLASSRIEITLRIFHVFTCKR